MNFEKFAPALGTWAEDLRPFIESEACDGIYAYLKKRTMERRVICPMSQDTWRAFRETPKDRLKCIFFLQDPYPWVKDKVMVADGIALSCRNTGKEQPSLKLFFDAIEESLPRERKAREKGDKLRNPDLSYLCNQGVMLLNTALTTEKDKPNAHSTLQHEGKKWRLWEPFMKFFLEEIISRKKEAIPLVFCGGESQYHIRYLSALHHRVFEVEHPAAAAHKERAWCHENIFVKINALVRDSGAKPIDWLDWDVPF